MPTLPHIAPCTNNIPCLKYPCMIANPQVAFTAPIMAGEDTNSETSKHTSACRRCQTFSQTHQPPGFSRWKPRQGQKYFQLLGKLSHDLMVNFTDIIAKCTITTARNNSNPYTDMKDPSCYLQLNLNGHATLTSTHCPCKGTRLSQLMAKLFSLMPGNAPTNTTTKNSRTDCAT